MLPEPYRSNLSPKAIADFSHFAPDWLEIEYEITAASLAGTDSSERFGTILVVPVTPLSRGYVNITFNSASNMPLVNSNQLSHLSDREMAVQAFKRA